jgi:hypothetical protein
MRFGGFLSVCGQWMLHSTIHLHYHPHTMTTEPTPVATDKPTPPYVAYTTLKNFLSTMRTAGGAPIVIDRSVFGGMSGGYQAQVKGALRFLGMIDKDSKPTVFMHAAVAATEKTEDWTTVVSALLNQYYPTIVAHPLTNTTPDALRKEFEATFGGKPDLISKAVTFFVHAAKDAGMPLSPRLTERQRGGGSRRGGPRRHRSDQPVGGVVDALHQGKPEGGAAGTFQEVSEVTAEGLTRLLKEKPPVEVQDAAIKIILYLTLGKEGLAERQKEQSSKGGGA